MKLGAHVSIAGGLIRAVERAENLGAETIQIFASSPQSFKTIDFSENDCAAFNGALAKAGIGPVFFHGVYLLNLASSRGDLYRLSIDSLRFYLKLCERIKSEGVIFHIGSHQGLGFESVKKRVVEAGEVLLTSTTKGKIIFENNAGTRGGVGASFSEIGSLVRALASERIGVCLDSQHAFAAGYDLGAPKEVERMLAEFDEAVGLENLLVVHLNDSKVPSGSLRDRHENLGEGFIGKKGLAALLNQTLLSDLPFIIETPGFENKGPDRRNMEILKGLKLGVE